MILFTLLSQAEAAGIVEKAAHEAGWVAALFALIVLSGFTLLGWFVRQLWNDLRDVQLYIRETLSVLISTTHECLGDVRTELQEFRKVLEGAPCGTEMRKVIQKYWDEHKRQNSTEDQ